MSPAAPRGKRKELERLFSPAATTQTDFTGFIRGETDGRIEE
jgi:hypothetical protein